MPRHRFEHYTNEEVAELIRPKKVRAPKLPEDEPIDYTLAGNCWAVLIRDPKTKYEFRSLPCHYSLCAAYCNEWNKRHAGTLVKANIVLDLSVTKVQ